MKKRITSLFLAVLMALTVVSTTAAATGTDDEGIMPCYLVCPICGSGRIYTEKFAPTGATRNRELTQCSTYYMCYKYQAEYYVRDVCTNCDEYVANAGTAWYTEWDHVMH